MVLKKNKCPHCNKKTSYFTLLKRKSKVYYYCEHCNKYSFLELNEKIQILFIALITLSLLAILFFSFIFKMLLVGTFLISLFFLAFYLLIPIFIDIKLQED